MQWSPFDVTKQITMLAISRKKLISKNKVIVVCGNSSMSLDLCSRKPLTSYLEEFQIYQQSWLSGLALKENCFFYNLKGQSMLSSITEYTYIGRAVSSGSSQTNWIVFFSQFVIRRYFGVNSLIWKNIIDIIIILRSVLEKSNSERISRSNRSIDRTI